MKKFPSFLFLGGAIVALSYLADFYLNLGLLTGWWVANIFHFFGGIYAFFFIRAFYYLTEKYHKTITAFWFEMVIFAGGALILGVFWEWYEFVFYYKFGTFAISQWSVTTYMDTIYDLMFDLVGATFAGAYLFIRNGKNK
ncbi:MAG: hypothetical protein Q7S78_02345 [Candidatus Azambacteria bacterium]|nr:hypothetical protein [Candidatus Azambacteria bacterium]